MKTRKWLERAVFINVMLLLVFVLADYFSWMRIGVDLEPLKWYTGSYSNLSVNPAYFVLTRIISIRGQKEFGGFTERADVLNFPLLVFLAAIILNVFIIYKIGKEST